MVYNIRNSAFDSNFLFSSNSIMCPISHRLRDIRKSNSIPNYGFDNEGQGQGQDREKEDCIIRPAIFDSILVIFSEC